MEKFFSIISVILAGWDKIALLFEKIVGLIQKIAVLFKKTQKTKPAKEEKVVKSFWFDSITAKKFGINNTTTNPEKLANLALLDFYVIEPLKERFSTITFSSIFRSLELNKKLIELKYRADPNSKHLDGLAVDFIVPKNIVDEALAFLLELPVKGTYYSSTRGHIHTELDLNELQKKKD